MSCPDPIDEWSQDQIGAWLRGLDAGLDQYKGRWGLNFYFFKKIFQIIQKYFKKF